MQNANDQVCEYIVDLEKFGIEKYLESAKMAKNNVESRR